MGNVNITSEAFDPIVAAKKFEANASGAGAIVSFTGYVRSEGGRVQGLRLSHYPGMTEAEIEALVSKASARWSVVACHVTHRVGDMAVGDAIVFVAAASAHRREAFEAADFLMDYLKSEAPFWKQEINALGEAKWIEPKARDGRDIARWS